MSNKLETYKCSFNAISANTRRWQSGMHTLSTNSMLKESLVSRFKNEDGSEGGFIFGFDASQSYS